MNKIERKGYLFAIRTNLDQIKEGTSFDYQLLILNYIRNKLIDFETDQEFITGFDQAIEDLKDQL